jgi:hypothetical protein
MSHDRGMHSSTPAGKVRQSARTPAFPVNMAAEETLYRTNRLSQVSSVVVCKILDTHKGVGFGGMRTSDDEMSPGPERLHLDWAYSSPLL